MSTRLDVKPRFSLFQKEISPGGKLPLKRSRDPKSTLDKGSREQSPKTPLAQPFLYDFIKILNNSDITAERRMRKRLKRSRIMRVTTAFSISVTQIQYR